MPEDSRRALWGEMVVVTPRGGVRLGSRPQGVLMSGGEYASLS